MARIKDEDYAYATARIRAKEIKLMSRSRLERLLDTADPSDAMKLLIESGYGSDHPEIGKGGENDIEMLLSGEMKKAYALLSDILPEPQVLDLFLRQYDYLNAKLIIKAEFMGIDVSKRLSRLGTLKPEKLLKSIADRKLEELPEIFGKAIMDSLEAFSQTGDPQTVDFILDKAGYENMMEDARNAEEPFLIELVKRMTDTANIRIFVRARLLSKSGEFIRSALIPGGSIAEKTLDELAECTLEQFLEELKHTDYADLSESLLKAVKHPNGISEVEKTLDDSILLFLKRSKYVTMGIEPVIAYLFMKETEIKNARLILTGKINKISQETIKERLRLGYA